MIELLFQFWQYLFCSIGCFLNIFLIILCIFKTPIQMHSYVTIIINFAITDLSQCLVVLFLQLRMIPMNHSTLNVYYGFCRFLGPTACRVGTSFFFHLFPYSILSLSISFFYRLHILSHPPLSRRNIILVLFLIYTPCAVQFGLNVLDDDDTGNLSSFSDETLSVVHNCDQFACWFASINVQLLCFPLNIFVFAIRRRIVARLADTLHHLSDETRRLHSQLLKCLTCQAILPLFAVSSVLLRFVSHVVGGDRPFLEFSIISVFVIQPILSPITYLYFVTPFRRVWKKK